MDHHQQRSFSTYIQQQCSPQQVGGVLLSFDEDWSTWQQLSSTSSWWAASLSLSFYLSLSLSLNSPPLSLFCGSHFQNILLVQVLVDVLAVHISSAETSVDARACPSLYKVSCESLFTLFENHPFHLFCGITDEWIFLAFPREVGAAILTHLSGQVNIIMQIYPDVYPAASCINKVKLKTSHRSKTFLLNNSRVGKYYPADSPRCPTGNTSSSSLCKNKSKLSRWKGIIFRFYIFRSIS